MIVAKAVATVRKEIAEKIEKRAKEMEIRAGVLDTRKISSTEEVNRAELAANEAVLSAEKKEIEVDERAAFMAILAEAASSRSQVASNPLARRSFVDRFRNR